LIYVTYEIHGIHGIHGIHEMRHAILQVKAAQSALKM
jgi:hypothetical protein